jgi:hypothetical protein
MRLHGPLTDGVAMVSFTLLMLAHTTAAEDVLQPSSQAVATPAGEAQPVPALGAVLKLFDTYQVVGLSDLHGCAELLEFVEQLVESPAFARQVDDLTFEPGNVRFQSVMDDFILHGQDVPLSELRRSWRENTQAHTYSDTPALLHLLQTIRRVNLGLPAEERIRVLLIDPPVDWSKIQSRDDLRSLDFDREGHMATVVEREVYAKGRKALFFAGGAHLGRGSDAAPLPQPQRIPLGEGPPPGRDRLRLAPAGDGAKNLPPREGGAALPLVVSPLQTLEVRHPGTTYAIGIHEGFGQETQAHEAKLDSWPKPALVDIRGTWLGQLPVPPSGDIFIGPDGKPVQPPSGRKQQDKWDAILYLGRRNELTRVAPPGPDVLDAQWLAELERRRRIMGRPPSAREQERPGRFFP